MSGTEPSHDEPGRAPRFEALAADRERSKVPTPRGPWIMGQRWEDLLFINWPVPVGDVRPLVADGVEIDTFEGSAWVSAVPMWMDHAHFRGLPPIPLISSFPEINVRTYVRSGEHRAVWFLTLDTESHINVFLARHAFHLPYEYAHVEMDRGDEIAFRSSRPGGEAAFDVVYRGEGDEFIPTEGTLESFVTERYSMVCAGHDGVVHRGDIQHAPWRIRRARHTARELDLVSAVGVDVAGTDATTFYAASTDVALWAPVRA